MVKNGAHSLEKESVNAFSEILSKGAIPQYP